MGSGKSHQKRNFGRSKARVEPSRHRFTGRRGGLCCTSALSEQNAGLVAFTQQATAARHLLFVPTDGAGGSRRSSRTLCPEGWTPYCNERTNAVTRVQLADGGFPVFNSGSHLPGMRHFAATAREDPPAVSRSSHGLFSPGKQSALRWK